MSKRTLTASQEAAQVFLRQQNEALGNLRQACFSLFKTMLPDSPDARVERHRVHECLDRAMEGRERLNVISLAFVGREDMMIEGYLHDFEGNPMEVSVSTLFNPPEESEAFLDPRHAIKVARRKYNMLALMNSMNTLMARRSIFSMSIAASIGEKELLAFCDLMSRTFETREEEESAIREGAARFAKRRLIELFYNEQVVGQTLKLPWRLKVALTLLRARAQERKRTEGELDREAQLQLLSYHSYGLSQPDLKAWILFGDKLEPELEGVFSIKLMDEIVLGLPEKQLASIILSLLETYHQLRKEHLGKTEAQDDEEVEESEQSFQTQLGLAEVGERLRTHAAALDRLQNIIGKGRFLSLAKAKRALDFQREAAEGETFDELTGDAGSVEAIERAAQQAYNLSDPAYRAKALIQLALKLHEANETDRASELAADAFLFTDEITVGAVPIIAEVLGCLLAVGDEKLALEALKKGLLLAHSFPAEEERAQGLQAMTSALLQAGNVSPAVRQTFTEHILGDDLSFWVDPAIQPALEESVLSLIDILSPQADLLARKLLAHPSPAVRTSTVRRLPFSNEQYRELILSHLAEDNSLDVRLEVIERVGYSGDAALGAYLINHLRRNFGGMDDGEKRSVALNLARTDAKRYLPLFSLMLGSLATQDPELIGNNRPFPDDKGLQLAAMEVLCRLNSREARKILWNAQMNARGELEEPFTWAWVSVKHKPYGAPELPRSRLDPEWTPEDDTDFIASIRPAKLDEQQPDDEPEELVLEKEPATPELADPMIERLRTEAGSRLRRLENQQGSPFLLALRARLRHKGIPSDDLLDMTFRLYRTQHTTTVLWEEHHQRLVVQDGQVSLLLGSKSPLPEKLPAEVFLGMQVQRSPELKPRVRIWRDPALTPEPAEEEEGL